MKIFMLLLLLLVSLSSFAKSQLVAVVDNQEDDSVIELYVDLDDSHDVMRFEVRQVSAGFAPESMLFETKQLSEGVSIAQEQGHHLVKLSSKNFAPHQGGELAVSYLHNGLTGSRRNIVLDLAREGDHWRLFHRQEMIQKIHIITKRWFGRAVGIQRLDFSYTRR